jgi:hypothetical protein
MAVWARLVTVVLISITSFGHILQDKSQFCKSNDLYSLLNYILEVAERIEVTQRQVGFGEDGG